MNIFITGIAGFLGSNLAHCLVALGHNVHGCDDMSTGDLKNLEGDHRFEVTDGYTPVEEIQHEHLTQAMHGCDVVYHCAAAAYEGVSVFSPAFISRNIYAGSAAVFSAAIAAGVRRIVSCSSMSRYGNSPAPFVENFGVRPVDPYGLAKASADKLLAMLSDIHGIEHVIAVPHNIYGPRQRYDDPYRNVAAIMVNRALMGKPPIVYGDGSQIRCFSYVDDVVNPLVEMATSPYVVGQVINVGPDTGDTTVLNLARMVLNATGLNADPIHLPPRPREVAHATCSATKARNLLGYAPKTQLRDGLDRLVSYVRERGPRPFRYHLDLEIVDQRTPATWTDRLM